MFNPNQAQINDQVLVEIDTFQGKKQVTGTINNIRNWSDYIDWVVYVNLDNAIALWNEEDIRDGFAIRVTPEGTSQTAKKRILA